MEEDHEREDPEIAERVNGTETFCGRGTVKDLYGILEEDRRTSHHSEKSHEF